MTTKTDDLRIREITELVSPQQLSKDIAVSTDAAETVSTTRNMIHQILNGDDDRLLVVVGPCSIHDPVAAREYAASLREAVNDLAADLLIDIFNTQNRN